MSLTDSNMLALGTTAPTFHLPFPMEDNNVLDFPECVQKVPVVVMFICNHCPYVIHVIEEIVQIAHEFQKKGVAFIGINSNDIESYPADSPEKMIEFTTHYQLPFPYLFDETQEVAKAYKAACTPDIYVFNGDHKLVYRGRLDSSRPGNDIPVDGKDLRLALNQLLEGKQISEIQYPSAGCNIKWKKT